MNWKLWLALGGIVLVVVCVTGCKLTRAGYESAAYKIVRKDGAFELRDYPALSVVSTPMKAPGLDDDSFRRLFQYISGSNAAGVKIAMTTPVFSDSAGTNRQMSFVLPREVATAGAPAAARGDVRLETRAGGLFAVHRYSGSWSAERLAAATRKLSEWIASERLEPMGGPQTANYDPPFIPPFLRRNEVMIPVKEASLGR